jgi:ribosomal protein L36
MRPLVKALALSLVAATVARPQSQQTHYPEQLQYKIEWRLIRAGTATLLLDQSTEIWNAKLRLQSSGLVSKLVYVDDEYRAQGRPGFCAATLEMDTREGKKRRTSRATFDPANESIRYVERDLTRNSAIVEDKDYPAARCVSDVASGLNWLRSIRLEPGQSTERWLSDGKKAAKIKVDALETGKVRTPAGIFDATRFEVHMMDGKLIRRSGRVFVWLSNDPRRLPVQIEIRLPFYIGGVTLTLEKSDMPNPARTASVKP